MTHPRRPQLCGGVLLALLLCLTPTAATDPVTCAGITCPPGPWICVAGACAKTCDQPYHNHLLGLCSGGAEPFAGVYCNSVEGTEVGVMETDRYDVKDFTCEDNEDCTGYGPGYFCDHFTPYYDNVHDHPSPQCVRPAAPKCFPLIPVCWASQCGAPANGTCPP